MENKTIWIKGSNDAYKKPILFKCNCNIEGESLILGFPFIKGKFDLKKFENNSEEKPFNYIIAIDTYEKAINKENPLEEVYIYFEKFLDNLEDLIKNDCGKVIKDISSDYKGVYFYLRDNRAVSQLRINLNRRTITKFDLSFENPFTREEFKKEYTNKDFVEFKERLEEFKELSLRVIKESKQENPYFKEVLDWIKGFKEHDDTEFYNISLRCHEFLDRLSIYFKTQNFKIPLKFNDYLSDNLMSYSINIDKDKIYLQNGSQDIPKEYLINFEKLKEFIINKIEEVKKSKVSKIKAQEELNRLREEEDIKTKLTEDKFKDFCSRFKEGEKITIYGAEGMFGDIIFEGKIYNIDLENKNFFVLGKGKRNRGLKFRIGSYYKSSERGYLK